MLVLPCIVRRVRPPFHRFFGDRASRRERLDRLGSWGWDTSSNLPLLVETSLRRGLPVPRVSPENVGVSSQIGKRAYNEDQYIVDEIKPQILMVAAFDGHGGPECAQFCKDKFKDHVLYWLDKGGGGADLRAVLQSAFVDVNNAFARWTVLTQKARSEFSSSGSTATVCLLRDSRELVVGHVGDSRAILCREGGEVRKLTSDHSPALNAEKERILSSGGTILETGGPPLVNGRLAMTRSIGDLELKPFGVTANPETRRMAVDHGRDAFLLVTTDGVNSVMSDSATCEVVARCGGDDPNEAAQNLTEQAAEFGSGDNATAIVVPLGSWGKVKDSAPVFHSFGRVMAQSSRFG